MNNFDLTASLRKEAWEVLLQAAEIFYADTRSPKVAPALDVEAIRSAVVSDFTEPMEARAVLQQVIRGLEKFTVHTSHPSYFGLFNPRPSFPSILVDTLAACFNPQLAAWSHAPFAVEIEQRTLQAIGSKMGYGASSCDGVFTTGGAEANLTALLCALNHHFPGYANDGLRTMLQEPVIYCSSKSHHSVLKAARVVGLGRRAVKEIPVDARLRLCPSALVAQIADDRAQDQYPLMVVATMVTTAAGAIDASDEIAVIARRHSMWLHADATYGGAVALSGNYRHLIAGIAAADSITVDAHKWLSVTMSCSLFLTRHPDILNRTFRVTTDYMPREAGGLEVVDPFTHSIQ